MSQNRDSRSKVSGMPLVIRFVYNSSRLALSMSRSRSSLNNGSPPVKLSWTTPSASASWKTLKPCVGVEPHFHDRHSREGLNNRGIVADTGT